jgi:decaprenylphospho-beta-D-ribofuranose 2-oxidase
MLADDAPPGAPPPKRAGAPLRVPFTPPVSLVARPSVRALNAVYYAAHGSGERVMGYDAFFFPLDRIAHWNRIYGPKGFIQHQALLPPETAAAGLRELLERLAGAGAASFLAVLKRTGPASGGILSFPRAGYTLALDIPHPRGGFERLAHELDRIVLRHGGRVYLAKDATLTPSAFREMYPHLDGFLAVKRRLDPQGRFASAQSQRLGIVADGTGAPR